MVSVTRKGPTNLVSPIDFRRGRLFLRLEVTEKPTDLPLGTQVCIWGSGSSETCSDDNPNIITKKGVYYFDQKPPIGWWMQDGGPDWSKTWSALRIMIRCTDKSSQPECIFARGGAPIFYTGADFGQNVPIVFRATAVFVPPGASLKAPAGWTCPETWPCR